MKKIFSSQFLPALLICFFFFVAYTVMGVMRQLHFLSGYDLAVVDQAIWKYSHFTAPISTNHAYAFTPIYWDHVELIYLLIAPFYWLYNSVYTLIVLQSLAISSSGIAVFLLAKKYGVKTVLTLSLMISYLMFYGIQNAIWADVHSLVFGVAFLAWFLYFVENGNTRLSWFFFFLTIFSKEDMALLTLIISSVLFVVRREKKMLGFISLSIAYLFFIFYIYFPHFVPGGYRFQSKSGLLSNINFENFYNTSDKQQVLLYSSLWFGFLPFFSPLYLLSALGDLTKYFVISNSVVTSGQSLFGHYRSSLAVLLIWPTIVTLSKFKKLNTIYMAIYILICAAILQYTLHLPLSYFAKKWFWKPSPSVVTMNKMIKTIPPSASVVTQINILPHLSHRTNEFVMWPETKIFPKNSPCGQPTCNWFRWPGSPMYMVVDVSSDWDVRYWLTNQSEFIDGLKNLENEGVIKLTEEFGTTRKYTVLQKP